MALVTKNFSDIIAFTRTGSTATYFNSAGVLTSAAADQPRFDYNPSTLAAQGLLIEEARTNSIRNNTMQGAVAGTPGTLPQVSGSPSWNISNLGTLTREVVGTGVVNGITYIDLRFSGTTSTTQVSIRLEPGGTGAIDAVNGQTWSMSLWSAVVAGGLTNISSQGFGVLIYDAAGAFLGATFSSGVITTTSTLTRTQASGTIATVGTAFIQPQIFIGFASGVAIDITLRIGLPQLEQGAFATSVIPTTTTALTRNPDQASVNTLSPWFNSAAGTLFAEFLSFGAPTNFPTVWQLDDGTQQNILTGYVFTNILGAAQRTLNVSQGDLNTVGAAINAANTTKMGYAYATNDSALSGNGSALTGVAIDNTVSIPTVTTLRLGIKVTAANMLNGYLRRITYYPRRLSNAELQSITT